MWNTVPKAVLYNVQFWIKLKLVYSQASLNNAKQNNTGSFTLATVCMLHFSIYVTYLFWPIKIFFPFCLSMVIFDKIIFFSLGLWDLNCEFPQARSVHEIQNIFLLKIFSSQTLCFFLKNFDSYLILNFERIPYAVIIFGD